MEGQSSQAFIFRYYSWNSQYGCDQVIEVFILLGQIYISFFSA